MLDFPLVSRDLRRVTENWGDLGRAVSYARRQANLSQKGLENRLKTAGTPVSDRTIRELENGNPVSVASAERIGQALHWPADTVPAVLQGLLEVSLSGEIHSGEQPTGRAGRFQRTVTQVAPNHYVVREPPPDDTTLQDMREAIADHERDFTVAVNDATDLLRMLQWTLSGRLEGEDPNELIESIRRELDKIVTFDHGRRYWQRHAETLLLMEPSEGGYGHRGRKSKVDNPEPHAE